LRGQLPLTKIDFLHGDVSTAMAIFMGAASPGPLSDRR